MKKLVTLCDMCLADGVEAFADGQYTTDEGHTFDACHDHLDECERFGFVVVRTNPREEAED